MANQAKQAQVTELKTIIGDYKNFVVIEYNKTTHKALEDLRRKLRKANASLKVLKNTLFEKTVEQMAEKDSALSSIKEKGMPLKGPSAMVGLSEDWSEGLKAYYDHAKKDESLTFKFGYVDGTAYDARNVEAIAKLPSKTELMAKVIGSMKTPMIKTVFSMKFSMQKFVTVLNEASKKGGSSEAAAS